MSDNDRPFITLPADQPDYDTLCDLTLEQKAAFPARFHTPEWLDTQPGAFVCRVCWDDGEVTGWPCASALAGRGRVFADPVDTPARAVSSETDTATAEPDRALPDDWRMQVHLATNGAHLVRRSPYTEVIKLIESWQLSEVSVGDHTGGAE